MLTMKNFLATAASTLLALFAISVSAQSADNGRFLSLSCLLYTSDAADE